MKRALPAIGIVGAFALAACGHGLTSALLGTGPAAPRPYGEIEPDRGITLRVRPVLTFDRMVQTGVSAKVRADIDHLRLELLKLEAGVWELQTFVNVPNAQLDSSVSFYQIAANSVYRCLAQAFESGDDSVKISDDALSTSQDIYVYTDDVVNPVEVRVRLLDAYFDGTTWSNIVTTEGQYYSDPASMSVSSPPPASESPDPTTSPDASGSPPPDPTPMPDPTPSASPSENP